MFFYKCFYKLRNVGNNIITFIANKYLRINNWNQNYDQILKLKDENVCDSQEKSKKEEIVNKLNELIHLLKDEGMSLNLE